MTSLVYVYKKVSRFTKKFKTCQEKKSCGFRRPQNLQLSGKQIPCQVPVNVEN